LKASPNIPDFLWFERALLADKPALVPRRLPLAAVLGDGFGHGRASFVRPLPPISQFFPGLTHNAQAALKLRIADSGRSQERLTAGSAPFAEIDRCTKAPSLLSKSGRSCGRHR